MKPVTFQITTPSPRIAFVRREGDSRPWWRDLDLNDHPLYRIGNICETCEAMFHLFGYAPQPVGPAELSQQFRQGLVELPGEALPQAILDSVAHILPPGDYVAALLEIQPEYLPHPLDDFGKEMKPFWKLPNTKFNLGELLESIRPIISPQDLNPDTIQSYAQEIGKGARPTALALSVVDVRIPYSRYRDWLLVHILLDGHHKVMAASQLQQPITLLSFLNLSESFAMEKYWVEDTVQARYAEKARPIRLKLKDFFYSLGSKSNKVHPPPRAKG